MTSCARFDRNVAPIPNRVSRSSAFVRRGCLLRQRAERELEHGQLHPARDVDADGIGNHRVPGGEHTADRQAVAHVRVGHERARHGDRELAGVRHLADGVGFETLAPDAIRRIVYRPAHPWPFHNPFRWLSVRLRPYAA